MPEPMEPRYDHKAVEEKIYRRWEESGYFNPDKCIVDDVCEKDAEPFSMVLPPPNVTGTLHTGSAAMLAIEDIITRYARMRGKRTVWIPGTDHAATATQAKVERILSKEEGKTKYDLGREAFLKRVEDFAEQNKNTILNQIRQMGASLDWSRYAYTLDDKRKLAVRIAFKKMYDDGLIYRGNRVVNWDPKGETVIADDEVVHEERPGKLYTFRYSSDFPVAIATTRPETKLGDTAVAVHPSDSRYKDYVGKEYSVNFVGVPLKIKVVADESVDKEFGTGAVGVTPAHSMTDWEIAQRHNLPLVQVINERGRMMVGDENIKDKKTTEAKEVILVWLRENGLLEKEEDITQNVSTSERTGALIEPLPKLQWFVNVNAKFKLQNSKIKGVANGIETTLKEIMRAAVANGQIKILPEWKEKVYFHWIDNLRDWCISRQLWFGHRIPAWSHEPECVPKKGHEADTLRCEQIIVSDKEPVCKFCEAKYVQDPDTLDTWFSASMWTFTTLGWPEETNDLKIYHPTTILETGYDILFFWVARMILMTGYLLGDIPFRTVYLHGLVRDERGRKMSKSLDNIVDPRDLIAKYGADALRLALIIGAAPGNDMKLSEDRVRGYRNFSTKIWNVARFIMMNKPSESLLHKDEMPLTEEDQKDIAEIQKIKEVVASYLEAYDFNQAGDTAYHYFWHTFADKIIEAAKPRLRGELSPSGAALRPSGHGSPTAVGESEAEAPARTHAGSSSDSQKEKVLRDQAAAYAKLETILLESLKMLHPFMPFVTEEIYQKFKPSKLLMIEKW